MTEPTPTRKCKVNGPTYETRSRIYEMDFDMWRILNEYRMQNRVQFLEAWLEGLAAERIVETGRI